MDEKDEKYKKLEKVLSNMINDIKKDMITKKDNKETDNYLAFLGDVIEFIEWTSLKYIYRYSGNNSRVVKKGEIFYCDLGINIGSEQEKRRPVVILQNDTGNKYSPTTIIAPITNTSKNLPVHVLLDNVQKGLKTTGLIMLEHIREVAKCRLGIYIEKIDTNSKSWQLVEKAIKVSLDLK
jgi:mRNA-degrading endonuclease toxin of MazEF toxin-antitoxin module